MCAAHTVCMQVQTAAANNIYFSFPKSLDLFCDLYTCVRAVAYTSNAPCVACDAIISSVPSRACNWETVRGGFLRLPFALHVHWMLMFWGVVWAHRAACVLTVLVFWPRRWWVELRRPCFSNSFGSLRNCTIQIQPLLHCVTGCCLGLLHTLSDTDDRWFTQWD